MAAPDIAVALRRHSAGLTLIEVLVALVILSAGLLGLAGLQAASAKYKINSWARSAITSLYSDIADRVRANPDSAGGVFTNPAGSVSAYVTEADYTKLQAAAIVVPTPDCSTATCTTAQQAAYDLAIWQQRVRTLLPQGAGSISGNRAAGMTVTLMWLDKGLVKKDGTLDSYPTCTGKELGVGQVNCCPAAAGVTAGVRCAGFTVTP